MHHFWMNVLLLDECAILGCLLYLTYFECGIFGAVAGHFQNSLYAMLEVEMRIMNKATFNGLLIGVYTA